MFSLEGAKDVMKSVLQLLALVCNELQQLHAAASWYSETTSCVKSMLHSLYAPHIGTSPLTSPPVGSALATADADNHNSQLEGEEAAKQLQLFLGK